MNHFEELGLSRSATSREIRAAYKTLAWLLHPDRQSNDKHRKMAELQMRRINESVGILLNAEYRRAYEAQLDAKARPATPNVVVVPPAPPERELWFRRLDARSVFLFVAGMAFASVLWHAFDATEPMQPRAVAANTLPDTDLRARVQELEERLNEMQSEANAATPKRPFRAANAGLSGSWSYELAPGQKAGDEAIPAGKRVYLAIAEKNGTVRGTYSSQGNPLAGQPANAVAFNFEGKAGNTHARLPWTAAGGGSGEIEMRLLAPDTLEAKWWAYSMAGGLPETSGSAILRRQTPR